MRGGLDAAAFFRRFSAGMALFAQLPPRFEHCKHLHGLSEAHVIGQTTAEAELPQKTQPAQTLLLIGTQLAREPGGRIGRLNAAESP
jgi:hypothetical protein